MERNTCPVCGKGELVELVGDFQAAYIDRAGVQKIVNVPNISRMQCSSCGEEILDDAASTAVEEARREARGLLTAEQIRLFRIGCQKTQTEMAEWLGVGEKTYCRWESGYVQSVASDNYLRLVRDVPGCGFALENLRKFGMVIEPDSLAVEPDFCFLSNAETFVEASAKFTNQLSSGRLYVCESREGI